MVRTIRRAWLFALVILIQGLIPQPALAGFKSNVLPLTASVVFIGTGVWVAIKAWNRPEQKAISPDWRDQGLPENLSLSARVKNTP